MEKWTEIRETETATWFRGAEGEILSVPKRDEDPRRLEDLQDAGCGGCLDSGLVVLGVVGDDGRENGGGFLPSLREGGVMRVSPHILRRPLGADNEAVATVPADPGRALLILRDRAAADSLGASAGFEGFESRAVSPAEISETCARHGLALVALYEVLEPEDLSILSVETVSEIFEEVE